MKIISEEEVSLGQIRQNLQSERAAVEKEKGESDPGEAGMSPGDSLCILDEIIRTIDNQEPDSICTERSLFQRVTYRSVLPSVNPSGDPCIDPPAREVELSALVIRPIIPEPSKSPILSYQHGTMFERKYAPSRCEWMSRPTIFPGLLAAAFRFAFVSGFVVVMPDYHGMGVDTEHCQNFVVSVPLAFSVGDLLLEVKESLNEGQAGKKPLFLAGYSQGGYVTMAFSKFIQENPCYSKEFDIIASAPMAGPYSLSRVIKNIMTANIESPNGAFFPLIMRGFHSAYEDGYDGIFTKEKLFKPEHQDLYDLVDGNHSPEEISKYMPEIPGNIFSQRAMNQFEDDLSDIMQVFRDNDAYRWRPEMKMKLFHCEDDDIVPFENGQVAHREFTNNGCDIPLEKVASLKGFNSTPHNGAVLPAVEQAFLWFRSLYPS